MKREKHETFHEQIQEYEELLINKYANCKISQDKYINLLNKLSEWYYKSLY